MMGCLSDSAEISPKSLFSPGKRDLFWGWGWGCSAGVGCGWEVVVDFMVGEFVIGVGMVGSDSTKVQTCQDGHS